jgi:hypothetical protein
MEANISSPKDKLCSFSLNSILEIINVPEIWN